MLIVVFTLKDEKPNLSIYTRFLQITELPYRQKPTYSSSEKNIENGIFLTQAFMRICMEILKMGLDLV